MTLMAPARSVLVGPGDVSDEEWAVRVDLAAAYRLAALYNWDDATATHISARIPGEETFLLNPHGLFFEEVTASNLIKIDLAGNILSRTDHGINAAGFVVHSAGHEARPDAGCVMHLHTDDGVAISCLAEGVMPLNQTALLIADQMAYHDYEGVAVDLDERQRLGSDLGQRNLMILRNHGTLTVGRNVGEAFTRMFILERAARIQMRVLATGRPIQPVSALARERTAGIGANIGGAASDRAWMAHRRKLDRHTTGYQH
jgi:ribulose-5-phosphate 4-epimerase/fuculose-1-phosphate aldolase